jgi:integrase
MSTVYANYRQALGVPNGTDFHSLRRTFITRMENTEGADAIALKRYVGHSVGGITHDLYSAGSTPATSAKLARLVKYPESVEDAALALVEAYGPRGK